MSARYGFAAGSGTRSSTRVPSPRRSGIADHRRAVAHRPRDVHRRLEARHEALVRIHERVRDRAVSARVAQQAADVMERRLAQLPLRLRVPEGVLLPSEQGLVRVHPAPVLPEDRFRHEAGEQAELLGDVFHHEPKGGDVVGRRQRVGIAEIDLVLAVRHFMVRGLDLEAHPLQDIHDRAPRVLAEVHRRKVEVAADVVRVRARTAVDRPFEHEELRFHSRVHREPELLRPCDLTLERRAWIASEGRAIRRVDVADDARHLGLPALPREDLEGREIGREQHVRFLDAHESFDRRAVEHDVPVERLLELRRGDLDVLVDPEDVGELQPKEAHVVRASEFEDLLLARARRLRRRRVGSMRHSSLAGRGHRGRRNVSAVRCAVKNFVHEMQELKGVQQLRRAQWSVSAPRIATASSPRLSLSTANLPPPPLPLPRDAA